MNIRMMMARLGAVVTCVGLASAVIGLGVIGPAIPSTDTSNAIDTSALSPSQQMALRAVEERSGEAGESSEVTFDQPGERMEFFLEQRLGPDDSEYPVEQLQETLFDIRAREAALAAKRGIDADAVIGWQNLGPGNIGGRTRALVIDENDPNIMYAGGVNGGIWKSTNGGASWSPKDDLLVNLAISDIVIDPADSNVLYAGTGEGFAFGQPFVRGLGIFKSVDAGETWAQLDSTVNGVPFGSFHYVFKVVVSLNDSNRVYAATRYGVWRSLDAGASWDIVLSNPRYIGGTSFSNGSGVGCTDLKLRNDRDPDVLWAAFGNFEQDGLFRSDDGGNTWIPYTTPSNQGRMTIALAPTNNDIVYLLMADNGTGNASGQLVQVFRSTDGVSFTSRVNLGTPFGPWLLSNLVLATGCIPGGTYSQGWYDNIIKVDPVDPDIVWVGGVDMFRSTDGGVNWELTEYWFQYLEDPPPSTYMHPDNHNIVFHPDYNGTTNQIMYVSNDGGIFRTQNARAAGTIEDCPFPGNDPPPEIVWENMNNSYAVTQFYHGDSARNVDAYLGGAQDNGSSLVTSRHTPDDWDLVFGGDGGYSLIDPRDPDTMFVEYQFFPTIQKSTDGGETFFEATTGITDTDGLFIVPMEMDQNDPDLLWTGGGRPWRTMNGADLWEVAGPNFAGPDRISAIGIAPSDSNVVYLGFNNGYVVRSTNSLDPSPTWTIFGNGLFGAWVSSVAVDPFDPDIAYITYSNFGVPHVLRTLNGGLSWQSIDGIGHKGVPEIPAHWVAVRPCNSQQLFVGTELGVFVSEDGGTNWDPFNDGLAHTIVETLDFKTDDTLVAFTHGRGAFLRSLEPCLPCEVGFVCPESFDFFGKLVGGDLGDLYASDDERLLVQSRLAPSPLLPAVSVTVEGTASTTTATELRFTYEGHASALPAVPQRIALFNYDTNSFETVDNRNSTSGDSIVEIVISTNADRFIDANGAVEAEISYFDTGLVFFPSWEQRVDQVKWEITP